MATIKKSEQHLLPHNAEAERAVVGSLLIDPSAALLVAETGLEAVDFLGEADGWVYAAVMELASRYRPADLVMVADVLRNRLDGGRSQLEAIGGPAALTGYLNEVPTSVHAVHYAGIVRRLAQQRRLISACGDIAARAQDHEGSIDELYESAATLFFEAVKTPSARSHLYGDDDSLLLYLARQDDRAQEALTNSNCFVTTGLSSLDAILEIVEPGYIQVVGARSSVGKTMYLEHVAEHNARRGHKVAYYHLELSHQAMLDRRMARHSGVEIAKLRQGDKSQPVVTAMDAIREWQRNIVYVHCAGWTAERIVADVVRLRAKELCDLAIVDYLQKLPLPEGKNQNSAMLIGHQMEVLKNCAENMEIPILTASQLSRDFKRRGDKRPRMEDLRNSGEIEERANQVVILHRVEERDETDFETELLQAHVDKNTNGRVGMAELVHVGGRFLLTCVGDREPDSDDWWKDRF